MKRSKQRRRVVVSTDGAGVVSHAGVGLLREMAEETRLVDGVTAALIGTYRAIPVLTLDEIRSLLGAYQREPSRKKVLNCRIWCGS